MPVNPAEVLIYHITDVSNLPGIISEGGLHSDAVMARRNPSVVIGYNHIKRRRLEEITISCCDGRFVGEFVPFYLCPRSPMLLAVNSGRTGRTPGCQRTIVHLVSTLAAALATTGAWAVSSGNAGAFHTTFDNRLAAVENLEWEAIRATQWAGRQHEKQAEPPGRRFLSLDGRAFDRLSQLRSCGPGSLHVKWPSTTARGSGTTRLVLLTR